MGLLKVLLANVALLASAAETSSETPIQDKFNNEVAELKKEDDFKKFVASNDRTIVLLKGPNCPICDIAEKSFREFMQEACTAEKYKYCDGTTVLGQALADDHKGNGGWTDLGKRFELSGYPTVQYYYKGQLKKTYKGFRKFLNTTRGLIDKVKGWEAMDHITEMKSHGRSPAMKWPQIAVVASLVKKSARQKALYEAMSELVYYDALDLKLAVHWLPQGSDPKKDASFKMVRSFFRPAEKLKDKDGYRTEDIAYEGTWTANKITQWIKDNAYPRVGRMYTAETYGPWGLEEMGLEASVVAVVEDKLHVIDKEMAGTTWEKVENIFDDLAKDFPKWKFTVTSRSGQGTHVVEGNQLTQLGVKKYSEDTYSEPLICVLKGKLKYVLEGDQDIEDIDQVKQFLENVQRGNIRATYKSELSAPTEPDETGSLVLTGQTFPEHALDPKKNVLVLYTAPPSMCKHCGDWTDVWNKISKRVKGAVVIARMNPLLNECEEDTADFPKLVLYPAVPQQKKMKKRQVYNGEANLEEVVVFIENYVSGAQLEL